MTEERKEKLIKIGKATFGTTSVLSLLFYILTKKSVEYLEEEIKVQVSQILLLEDKERQRELLIMEGLGEKEVALIRLVQINQDIVNKAYEELQKAANEGNLGDMEKASLIIQKSGKELRELSELI